uniref:Cytochrome c biogenesis protein n=1 Tax=Choristocarpus tenellus TaxID=116065 RepID=UPI002E764679|nr:Cytochrome c biogenesis protein [Choristocarpus tenellus]WAM62398.1 Cytochrome c biogenesis protein [Choristocarpus tenellus]
MLFDTYSILFTNSLFIFLFVSTICYWGSLIFTNKFIYNLAKISTLTVNILLFIFLLNRWINFGYFPLSNLYESLLFLASLLLIVYQFLEYKTKSKLLGALIIPIILLIYSFANLTLPLEMQKASALVPALQSNWLMMHVSLMMLSYATLIIGSVLSILFLIISLQNLPPLFFFKLFFNIDSDLEVVINSYLLNYPNSLYLEKKKRGKLLQNIDNWSYRTISLGFPFLTIGIIAGAIWANEAWGSYWSWDPKETWALVTWLVFASYLHVRLIKGWEGRNPAILGSIGFFVVWICYLGVNFLGQGLHSYGWLS